MNTLVRLHRSLGQPLPSSLAARAACGSPAEQLLASFFQPLQSSHSLTNDATLDAIKLDVSESESAYQVAAAIAGAKREDIEVAVEGNRVTIRAEVKGDSASSNSDNAEAPQPSATRLLHSERFYGKTSRAFTLPQEINEEGVQAKYADGILSLTLPKKVQPQPRKVTIS